MCLQNPARSLRVLLVEDHMDTARILSRLLKRSGHAVTVAHSIHEAIDAAERLPFDALLSSIHLPDGNGMDLFRDLRRRSPGLLGVAMTSVDGLEADTREAGFASHLMKPLDWAQVARALVIPWA